MILNVIISTPYASERYIHIMRHGEGDHNLDHYFSSNPDHPNYKSAHLTALGKKQAAATAKKLKQKGVGQRTVAQAFVSPLPRTKETSLILIKKGIFKRENITIDPRLIEIQVGNLEGQYYDPKTLSWDEPNPSDKNAENSKAVRCRMMAFYNDVVKQYPEGDIVVVSHGSPAVELIELLTDKRIYLGTAESRSILITNTQLSDSMCS